MKIDKLLKYTEFNLNESLFMEDQADMVGRPTKKANLNKVSTHNKTGMDKDGRIPKDEAWLLIKLYEATVDPGNMCDVEKDVIDPATGAIIGNGGISRKNLLKLCGNANYDTPGEASTFFSGLFKDLDLAYVKDGIVYPGPNLEAWLDDTKTLIIPNKPRYKNDVGKEYAHEPNMRRFIGAGNVGKKTACSATERNRPNPLADLKGISVKPADESPVASTPIKSKTKKKTDTYASKANDEFEKNTDIETEWDDSNVDWEDNSEDIDWGDDDEWVPMGESIKTVRESLIDRETSHIEHIKSAYKQHCGLEEDVDITDDNFDSHKLRVVCLKHGWPYAETKEKLFSKGI